VTPHGLNVSGLHGGDASGAQQSAAKFNTVKQASRVAAVFTKRPLLIEEQILYITYFLLRRFFWIA
jgi:hypothetical protein